MAVMMYHEGMKALTQVSVTEAKELVKLGWREYSQAEFDAAVAAKTKKVEEVPAFLSAPVAEETEPATIEAQPIRRAGRPRKADNYSNE